jgi:hypothetical protein
MSFEGAADDENRFTTSKLSLKNGQNYIFARYDIIRDIY